MKTPENSGRNLEIAPATWHTIRPHLKRDAVIVVSPEQDLKKVAEEIAADNTTLVSAWIEEGSLSKPSHEQAKEWDGDPTREFQCAIVQPFVLMQLPEAT